VLVSARISIPVPSNAASGVLGSDKWRFRRQVGQITVWERLGDGRIVFNLSGEIGKQLFINMIAAGQHSHRKREHGLHRSDVPLKKSAPLGQCPVETLIDAAFQVQVYDWKDPERLPNAVDALLYL
jgi:hypothetical protein